MNIVYCIGESGHDVLLAALKSVDSLSEKHKKYIFFDHRGSNEVFSKFNYFNYVPIYFEDLPKDLKEFYVTIPKVDTMPINTYLRLLLPYFFQDEPFLYLDYDTIVLKDLEFSPDTLEPGYLYAVKDEGIGLNYLRKIGLPPTHVYFNAGVLFFNRVSTSQYLIKLKEIINLSGKNNFIKGVWDDQDILNNIFLNYRPLSAAFNFQTNSFIKDLYMSSLKLSLDEIRIVHFVGPAKPWFYPTFRVFKRYNLNYYSKIKRRVNFRALRYILRFNGFIRLK